ncbi:PLASMODESMATA CALLOSE-BINDING PROTEIN 4 [Amaranthus tricolor]|uniref:PLASMODESMATA CALLOSE-BINDING PROTEIN 4 n=1 Tax=Amaranthus tricolor TaxID=29722 RepID=UPI00258D2434|nr:PLASMODESMATA CALLOSE-BINDING PROTEIN 4 [Amaranthus tricolor]
MARLNSLYFLFVVLSSQCISKSGGLEEQKSKAKNFQSSSNVKRKLQNLPPYTPTPITNPANFPPYTPTPAIVTIPGSTPSTQVNPFPTPTSIVPDTTNPTQPILNPANPENAPVVYPLNQPTNAPITRGQTWCIAKTGAPETALQEALDYACGIGGADCSTIQQGGICYNPNSLENHASVAFNSYFQKNPSPTSCDFGGTAVLVNTNPSTGTCVYPSSATGTGTAMPLTTNPPVTGTPFSTIPTPTTSSSTGTTGSPYSIPASGIYGSPSLTNPGNPGSLFPTSYGPDSPPTGSSFPAGSATLRPHISLIILVAFFFTG